MPLVIDAPQASFRLNYLFNRIEISHDFRQTWSIFYEDEAQPMGALRGLTFHRGLLFIVTDAGIFSTSPDAPAFTQVSPQRKGAEFVDIESFDNMLYACTNEAIFQASSGSRWRLKYDGNACGHFFSLLNFQGKLFAACEKGIYVASQEGRFWHPRFISKEIGMFVALDGRGDKLFAQTDKGFYMSDDDAQHWRPQENVQGPWTAAMGGTMLFEPRLKKTRKKFLILNVRIIPMFERPSHRQPNEMRPVRFTTHYTKHAEGSVLVEVGDTKVICTASVIEGKPKFLKDRPEGWVTAEYGLLPRATHTRCDREAAKGKQSGRTQEIQRLIGRALRAVVDRTKIDNFTIQLDCDVIQADGGTRCASISGAWVALAQAVRTMLEKEQITENPLKGHVAAISAGIYEGVPVIDLDYPEDSNSETDMNFVMTSDGRFVEIQGTAEGEPFTENEMAQMTALAKTAIAQIIELQKAALAA